MSWEDWLNESIAEAIAVSYLKFTFGQETYEKYMKKEEKYDLEASAIRTEDGSRPEGVRFKGVYLFYLASKVFDKDIMVDFIKIFVDLKKRTYIISYHPFKVNWVKRCMILLAMVL